MTRALTPVTDLREAACGRTRRLLDSYLAGELTVESNHEILDHLSRCPACAAESDAREKLRRAVRRVAASDAEPREGFEAGVRTLLARTNPPLAGRPGTVLLLVAAALVGALSLAALVVPSRGPGAVARRGAVDEQAYLVAARTQVKCTLDYRWPVDSPGMTALEAKIRPALTPALHSVSGALRGYHLVAAHECDHAGGGRKAAHFILRRDGDSGPEGLVSVLALPKSRGSLSAGEVLGVESSVGKRYTFAAARAEGFDVVGTESEGYLLFVVSARGRSETFEMSRRALPVLAAALVPAP